MQANAKRVLIVDDAKSMRAIIRQALEKCSSIEVVGEAADASDARLKLKALSPDVVTLDVEMPVLRGDLFLKQIMTMRPTPVVMLSQSIPEGSAAALAAIRDGASDCVGKPTSLSDIATDAFGRKLRDAVLKAALPAPQTDQPVDVIQTHKWNGRAVFIGASTGGVTALETILREFSKDCPPTIVAQHMPAHFVDRLVEWLDRKIAPTVQIAAKGKTLQRGQVFIAPAEDFDLIVRPGNPPVLDLVPQEPNAAYCPSIDALFHSAATLKEGCVAAILTGMGKDGADGLHAILRAGGHTIAQDAKTSVVYGMPGAAVKTGAVIDELPLPAVGRRLLTLCERE